MDDTKPLDDAQETKPKKGKKAKADEAPAVNLTSVAHNVEQRAPATRKADPWANLVGRSVAAVQFHQAPGGKSLNSTGISKEHLKKTGQAGAVEMRLIQAGIWVLWKGVESIVPFSNIVRIELEDA